MMSRKTEYQLVNNVFHDKNDEERARHESAADNANRVLGKVMHGCW